MVLFFELLGFEAVSSALWWCLWSLGEEREVVTATQGKLPGEEETCTTMLSMSPHGECLVDQHYDSFLWCCWPFSFFFIRFYAFWYPFKSRFCWACSVVASFAVVVVVVNHHYSDSSTAIVLYCWCILFLDLHLNELAIQVHLGFDQWSKGVQRCDLLPSGLAAEGGEAILACLAAWLSIRKAQVLLRERGWRWP